MDESLFNVTVGALLHDIGKVIYRAGLAGTEPHPESGKDFIEQFGAGRDILDCIKYHHYKNLKYAGGISENSPAYIVYVADNISAGMDRREKEAEGDKNAGAAFDRTTPLASVFNLLNNKSGDEAFRHREIDRRAPVNYPRPKDKTALDAGDYAGILKGIRDSFSAMKMAPEYINSMLAVCEAYLSFVPSSTDTAQVPDVSLFDHQKIAAAVASAMHIYLKWSGKDDYKRILFQDNSFYEEKAFLMFSCDISGIQDFIYTIVSKKALKALRARSFYLEMLLEHSMDLLFRELGLSRANLLYTGGGHAFALLPNCPLAGKAVESVFMGINNWLREKFGTSLYIAFASEPCSPFDLMNKPLDRVPLPQVYRNLSREISIKKLKRYGFDDIMLLNSKNLPENTGRECKTCGRTSELQEDEDICLICGSLQDMSNELIKEEKLLLITSAQLEGKASLALPLPGSGDCFMHTGDERFVRLTLQSEPEKVMAVYGKNHLYTGLKLSTKIWMGDYYAASAEPEEICEDLPPATFRELAERATGIKRIGVLRADVDDLGKAFLSGFVRENEDSAEKSLRYRYETISRKVSFSRMLSLFFKLNINSILKDGPGGGFEPFRLDEQKPWKSRSVTIVYSGGDDIFLVGAWDEVLEAAVDMRRAFSAFCGGTLTISAGFGMFGDSYPVSRMAYETAELEDAAKRCDGKDSIALFGWEMETCKSNGTAGREREKSAKDKAYKTKTFPHLYKWKEFEDKVVGEKLRFLQRHFAKYIIKDAGYGKTMAYKFMEYLKAARHDRVNIARFAYLLGRLAPEDGASPQERSGYAEFGAAMYRWMLEETDRRQLITAFNIMLYLLRGNDKGD